MPSIPPGMAGRTARQAGLADATTMAGEQMLAAEFAWAGRQVARSSRRDVARRGRPRAQWQGL
jgi:hypothetical protein